MPIPHPLGWVGDRGQCGETDPRDAPTRAEKGLIWGVVCSCWGSGGGNLGKGQRGHPAPREKLMVPKRVRVGRWETGKENA